MRKSILILALVTILGCKNQEEINVTVPYEESVMLLGKANKDGLMKEPFNEWFIPEFDSYQLNDSLVEQLKPLLKDTEITVFMGTWCSDSQREIPHFYKILETADFDFNNFALVAVNDEKTTPQEFEKDLNITNVPTFIFYRNGKELNRIVEFPIESLEEDMMSILKGEDYQHPYSE